MELGVYPTSESVLLTVQIDSRVNDSLPPRRRGSLSIVVPLSETSQWSVAGEPTGHVPVEPQGTDEWESMEMAYA